MRIDGRKEARGQRMGFQKRPELEQGRGIRRTFPRQVNANETADSLTVVERIFRGLIRKTETVLRQVHAQHPLKTNRRPTSPFATRIVGLNLGTQRRPRRHDVEFVQEPFPPRHLLLGGVF